MFLKPDDFRAAQEREGGSVRLSDILTAQSLSLFKVDLLACVVMIPLVTLPGAVMAMNDMARRMVREREANTREFFASLRKKSLAGLAGVLPGQSAPRSGPLGRHLLRGTGGAEPHFLPALRIFSQCADFVPVSSAYLYPLACAMPLKQAVRTSRGPGVSEALAGAENVPC